MNALGEPFLRYSRELLQMSAEEGRWSVVVVKCSFKNNGLQAECLFIDRARTAGTSPNPTALILQVFYAFDIVLLRLERLWRSHHTRY